MNHATRFYNTIKILYKDDPELFSEVIKEFDSVIRNNIYIPAYTYSSTVFNDESAIITINGENFITSTKEEFFEYIFVLFQEHPGLRTEFLNKFG